MSFGLEVFDASGVKTFDTEGVSYVQDWRVLTRGQSWTVTHNTSTSVVLVQCGGIRSSDREYSIAVSGGVTTVRIASYSSKSFFCMLVAR